MIRLASLVKIVAINKPTKAKLFSLLKVGDIIRISMPIKNTGYGRSGMYAPEMTVTNVGNDETTTLSLNQLGNVLRNFTLETV